MSLPCCSHPPPPTIQEAQRVQRSAEEMSEPPRQPYRPLWLFDRKGFVKEGGMQFVDVSGIYIFWAPLICSAQQLRIWIFHILRTFGRTIRYYRNIQDDSLICAFCFPSKKDPRCSRLRLPNLGRLLVVRRNLTLKLESLVSPSLNGIQTRQGGLRPGSPIPTPLLAGGLVNEAPPRIAQH